MSIAALAELMHAADDQLRWRLVAEFLENIGGSPLSCVGVCWNWSLALPGMSAGMYSWLR